MGRKFFIKNIKNYKINLPGINQPLEVSVKNKTYEGNLDFYAHGVKREIINGNPFHMPLRRKILIEESSDSLPQLIKKVQGKLSIERNNTSRVYSDRLWKAQVYLRDTFNLIASIVAEVSENFQTYPIKSGGKKN